MIDQLYKEYGELMINQEIIQSKIQIIKRKIADDINKTASDSKKEKIEERNSEEKK